jgi:hypothetical protein
MSRLLYFQNLTILNFSVGMWTATVEIWFEKSSKVTFVLTPQRKTHAEYIARELSFHNFSITFKREANLRHLPVINFWSTYLPKIWLETELPCEAVVCEFTATILAYQDL